MSEASQTPNDLAEALNGLTDLNFQLPYPEDSDLPEFDFQGLLN
ncbi:MULTISPECIES: hypothetical protein [unclassified Microcoleus]